MSRVLLIEPDHLLAKNTCRALKRAGHTVDWSVEPQAAVNLADTHIPDVVIIDMLLAGRSGIEFLYEFRSYPDWQAIPVIVCSSLPEHEVGTHEHSFAQLDIRKFLYKPHTSLTDLVQAVGQILQPVSG